MLHKTKAIILRTVKFGETSLIVTAMTELFGVQSYIVNGVRQASSKGTAKASYFQPGADLDLVVYRNEFKNLQRIKEYRWAHLHSNLYADVFKNAVAVFAIELLGKSLKEPEPNNELFYFVEDALRHLDQATPTVTANFPIFFALHLAVFFGFRIPDHFSEDQSYLDLQEGLFSAHQPTHAHYLEGREAEAVAHVLKAMHPGELEDLKLHSETRRRILAALETYYALHIADFGQLKTLPVLREILS
jgi:DNA repair protein RecO (recombination protein O)